MFVSLHWQTDSLLPPSHGGFPRPQCSHILQEVFTRGTHLCHQTSQADVKLNNPCDVPSIVLPDGGRHFRVPLFYHPEQWYATGHLEAKSLHNMKSTRVQAQQTTVAQ